MKVVVLRSARLTIQDGFEFYERQYSGLGRYFVESILKEIKSLKQLGGIHQKVHERYYRMVCKDFPFSIYYTMEGSEVRVQAILDNRMDPERIRQKLE
jgi:plasmid stabilization system protein ParE